MHKAGCQQQPVRACCLTLYLLYAGAFCVSSFDRRLVTAAPTEEVFDFVEDTQGWVNGRATFVGPTPQYLAQFQNRHAP